MRARHVLLHLAAFGVALTPVGCGGSGVNVFGAGASFPAPLYKRWMREYHLAHRDVRVSYQAIGSGAGIRQFTQGVVDFGATDAFMSADEIKEFHAKEAERPNRNKGLLQVPLTAGSVVICYNVPGVGPGLKLTRDTYVGIFLGKITSWNDPAIQASNPNVDLPSLEITVVRRAESSGTTAAFTTHLNAIDKRWHKDNGGPGAGKSVVWPVGIGGRGNNGVAALIDQTPGAIGYIEYGYAELARIEAQRTGGRNNLPMADLQNKYALQHKTDRFIEPGPDSGRLALAEAKVPTDPNMPFDFKLAVPDPEGPDAYPIVTYTWALLYTEYRDGKKAATLREVLRYCLTDGQKIAGELGYIPLPEALIARALKAVDTIQP
jgi:phosphate transport system substrate-binding protein